MSVTTTNVSPEFHFLLACLQENQTSALQQIELTKLEWEHLVTLTKRHMLDNILHDTLKAQTSLPYPKELQECFTSETSELVKHELLLTGELLRVYSALTRAHIDVLAFKGPVLAARLYGDKPYRHFTDIDLLIRKEDFQCTSQILLEHGYTYAQPINAAQRWSELNFQNAIEFEHSESHAVIDIHWDVVRNFYSVPFNTAGFFSRAVNIELHGKSIRCLAAEDLLLVLAVHGGKHTWKRLDWIVDIKHLLTSYPDLDWAKVISEARNKHIERMLLVALCLPQQLFQSALPPEIEQMIAKDREVLNITRYCINALVNETTLNLWQECKLDIWMREHPAKKLRYLFYRLATPHGEDWRFVALPSILYPLYYLVRPVRLIMRYIGIVV